MTFLPLFLIQQNSFPQTPPYLYSILHLLLRQQPPNTPPHHLLRSLHLRPLFLSYNLPRPPLQTPFFFTTMQHPAASIHHRARPPLNRFSPFFLLTNTQPLLTPPPCAIQPPSPPDLLLLSLHRPPHLSHHPLPHPQPFFPQFLQPFSPFPRCPVSPHRTSAIIPSNPHPLRRPSSSIQSPTAPPLLFPILQPQPRFVPLKPPLSIRSSGTTGMTSHQFLSQSIPPSLSHNTTRTPPPDTLRHNNTTHDNTNPPLLL